MSRLIRTGVRRRKNLTTSAIIPSRRLLPYTYRHVIMTFLLWFVLFLCPVVVLSQPDYHPFLKEGKVWNYTLKHVVRKELHEDVTSEEVSYRVNGDTIIEGKDYKKLLYVKGDEQIYFCAMREDDKKVWMNLGNWGDKLLFDFGMKVGDSYEAPRWGDNNPDKLLTLAYRGEIVVNGENLTVMYYSYNGGYLPIIEGVGSSHGWRIMDEFVSYPNAGDHYSYDMAEFISCSEDDGFFITIEDVFVITTGKRDAIRNKPNRDVTVNLQGHRLIKFPLRKGVYIQDGRKRVIE